MRNDLVVVAPDDQRRHVDAVQPLAQMRIVEPRLPGEVGGRERFLIAMSPCSSRERLSEPLLGKALIDEQVARRALPATTGTDRPSATPLTWMPAAPISVSVRKPARAAHRDFGRDPAAERIADQMEPVEAERLDEVEIEIGKVAELIEPVRRVGAAETRMLRHDHVVALRQRLHERQPDAGAAARHAGTAAAAPLPPRITFTEQSATRTVCSRAGSQDGTSSLTPLTGDDRMDLPVVRSTPSHARAAGLIGVQAPP